jgi:hypothetical protein
MFGQFNGQENYSGALQNLAISGGERLTAGAHALTRSEDSIAGTANEAVMKIEFYSEAGAEYGSTFFLGEAAVIIADGSSPEDTWSYSELAATAPSNAVEARVTLQFKQPASNPGGAVFVDSVTLLTTGAPLEPGDANGDGVLNNLDIASFVLALTNPVAYQTMFPDVDPDVVLDMNGDGGFDNLDIASFVAALSGGGKK